MTAGFKAEVCREKLTLICCVMQTAEALQERAKRIYEKYGNVMLDVGVRLASTAPCRPWFSPLMLLCTDNCVGLTGQ